ncbi:MAG: sugar ABC transporter permease [Pseudomonadota bacterium]
MQVVVRDDRVGSRHASIHWWDRFTNDKRVLAYLFLLPTTLILLSVVIYPFGFAFSLAFQSKMAGSEGVFVGLRNFVELFSKDEFLLVIYNTIFYTAFGVGIKFCIGLISALVLNQPRRFNNIYRTILFIPWAVPTVIATLNWLWVYDEFNGLLNIALMELGILDNVVAWTAEPNLAMWAVIAVVVWNGTPFYTMHFLAGLQSIPKELYEAAELDGASRLQQFLYVTVPSMRHVFMITVMLSTVFTSTSIVVVHILTNGAPANRTEILPNFAYNLAIGTGRLGIGSAVNLVFLPFLVIFIILITRRMLQNRAG